MSIKEILARRPKSNIFHDIAPAVMERWNPAINASEQGENTITILDAIGEDYWGDGVSAKRIAAALRSIGASNDVTVLINSPGGDMFEGLAIYSLLKEHKGRVTVKILSLAASAASVIAMAGDEIQIARSGFFMIHNAWIVALGNRNELREYADWLEPFDEAMADLYAETTGLELSVIQDMMNTESWIGGTASIDKGFATGYLESDEVVEDDSAKNKFAAQKIDLALAKSGVPRSERRRLMAEMKEGMQNATIPDTHNAVYDLEPMPRIKFPK